MRSTSVLLIGADNGNSRHYALGRVSRRAGALMANELADLRAPGETVVA